MRWDFEFEFEESMRQSCLLIGVVERKIGHKASSGSSAVNSLMEACTRTSITMDIPLGR